MAGGPGAGDTSGHDVNDGTVLVTGGAGFIGSALVRRLIAHSGATVVNVDKLTYSGNLESLGPAAEDPRHRFERVDIADAGALRRVFTAYRPGAVVHLAAESHVDRSIDGPDAFVETNIVGTYRLLQAAVRHWRELAPGERAGFRFHHVSTDEVHGSVDPPERFTEDSPHRPSSPYAASKAAAEHLVFAWHRTYGLPATISRCSNNYGPYQFPEKLMPLMILNGLEGKPLPVYGDGENVRDWLHVDDHVDAILRILARGTPGRAYDIGGDAERSNLEVVRAICGLLDAERPGSPHVPHDGLIEKVTDRPGHDRRYATDAARIRGELGWAPRETFESGLARTVRWYLANLEWCGRAQADVYRRERLGLEAGR